jgi:predicted unusual protein kinase regulating ubiquinone biosynthesis (AarF/ABC1/UbiB family)
LLILLKNVRYAGVRSKPNYITAMPPEKTENSLSSRAKRYAKTGVGMAKLGTKLGAEKYLGVKVDRAQHAAELRAALGGLKGPLMKVAQILGTIPDLVPPEYAAAFKELQSNAPPMGWPFVKRRMMAELGTDWEKNFAEFSRDAVAAASLGQVHKAIDKKGRALACKLQYPDMQAAVEADLSQLKILMAVFERIDRAVDTRLVQAELAERLYEELDYRREAKHMKLFAHMLADVDGVHVPQVVDALSTDRLLTMTWLNGQHIDTLTTLPLAERNAIAERMFNTWYVPFYNYGVIHGDPHLGNYTFAADGSINLLDYGCVRVFKPSLVAGVIKLYHAVRTGDEAMAVDAYSAWGFANPSKQLVKILNIWASFIMAPLLEDRPRLIEETNTGQYGRETANKVHAELRKIGGVAVPREFVFMDRAAVGLGSVFLRLKAEVNWHQRFNALTQGFDEQALAARQTAALKMVGLDK